MRPAQCGCRSYRTSRTHEHPMQTRSSMCIWLLGWSWTSAAWAQTDEIQVYNAEIVDTAHWNLTWHNNFTPSGRTQPELPGGVVPDHANNGGPEWAYGVTDWFEAGA